MWSVNDNDDYAYDHDPVEVVLHRIMVIAKEGNAHWRFKLGH
jgi:hypothetical protein